MTGPEHTGRTDKHSENNELRIENAQLENKITELEEHKENLHMVLLGKDKLVTELAAKNAKLEGDYEDETAQAESAEMVLKEKDKELDEMAKDVLNSRDAARALCSSKHALESALDTAQETISKQDDEIKEFEDMMGPKYLTEIDVIKTENAKLMNSNSDIKVGDPKLCPICQSKIKVFVDPSMRVHYECEEHEHSLSYREATYTEYEIARHRITELEAENAELTRRLERNVRWNGQKIAFIKEYKSRIAEFEECVRCSCEDCSSKEDCKVYSKVREQVLNSIRGSSYEC